MSKNTIFFIVFVLIDVVVLGLVIAYRMMRGAPILVVRPQGVPSQNSSTRHPVVGWVIAVLGGLGLLTAFGLWVHTLQFTHSALHTSGKVIAMHGSSSSKGGRTYAPKFRFRDAAGIERVVTSSIYQPRGAFQVGDTVPVLYLRDSPETARIDSFQQMWGAPTTVGQISIVPLLIGVAFIWFSRLKTVG